MNTTAQLVTRLCGIPLALTAALLLPLAEPASAHRIEKHFTVQGRPVVTVNSNVRGRIEVRSWKKAEVVVIGNHASDKVEVDTEQADNRIEVFTHILSENVKSSELDADYQITVPEETQLQIRTDSGLVVVERVYGDLSFETVAADVQLEEVGGYLVVKTVGGTITCTRCLGRINVTSISGNVQLFQPQMDNVRVQTTSGNIFFDGDFRRSGIYILKNHSGLIEVRFSDTDSFDLSATSLKGEVENQANLKPDPHGRHQSLPRLSKSILGTFNEGHAKVELSSFSGTIKIRKRD
jgi:DUF4097 and DUF4098 domain-containing protein YvlB